ncbi:unnamed protein product [Phaedon cochleariae]|uniref:Vitellogenin n=1 Tax=Phaedon cochleariae TaxID=80249 RepID=A0A9P0GNY2_PHACE|nr:unnamed protein product [Phaedon cochleariae]
MVSQSFQVELKHGAISGIIFNKHTPNWEVNIIKGIMSQFQYKLNREDSIQKADDEYNLMNFKVMEETITGKVETHYEVKQIPKKYVSTFDIDSDEDLIEVVKHKDYTNNVNLPSYFFGFGGMEKLEPATNQMKEFFLRDSTTYATLTGNVNNFTLKSSLTVNKVFVNPTLSDKQKGLVVSIVNVTLEEVKRLEEVIEKVDDPLPLVDLVYSYEYIEEHSSMKEAPKSPMLPFTMGYRSKSGKVTTDIIRSVQMITRDIVKNMDHPTEILHQSTVSKFVTLTSLIRIMNEAEIKVVGDEFYSAEGRDETWIVFRDAVAGAGTGPSLLIIQNWILSRRIRGIEASHILSTMTKSVRKPSVDYMRSYFQLIKEDLVQREWPLNDTAILSYSDLIREVYFHNTFYRAQYPIKSFPGMQSDEGIVFARGTVIPYLTKKLDMAIRQGKLHSVHAYIRAIGNTGAPDIIPIFKPYLEGTKQISQYQRLLMVASLDKLVKTNATLASDCLFKIYQNIGDSQEIRITAVYQLMRTKPTTEILQIMASYTNIDTHEYVNAAVKSSIESAAKLEGLEFRNLRNAAKAAKPLLTQREYAREFGGNYLRTYFIEELKLRYKETVQVLNSEVYPKGFKYALRSSLGGLRNQLVNIQALVSSIDDLIQAGKELTEHHYYEKQVQHAAAQGNSTLYNLERFLNIHRDPHEQLEGSLHFLDMGDSPLKMFSLDIRTFENIPRVIEMLETILESGLNTNYTKFINRRDLAVSFPMEMGLPFLFTYDTPMLVQTKGTLRAVSDPKISERGRIRKPKNIKISADAFVTITSKIQGRLTFMTPFDHQQYIAGFDKHWQVHIPIRGGIEFDAENFEVRAEVKPEEHHDKAHLFHYSTWPYTSRINIIDFHSVSSYPTTHFVKPENVRRLDTTLGKEELGLALRIQVDNWRFPDASFENDIPSRLLNFWSDPTIKYSHINVTYIPEESITKKLVLQADQLYKFKDGQETGEPVRWYDLIQDGTVQRVFFREIVFAPLLIKKLFFGPFSAFLAILETVEAYFPGKNHEHVCIIQPPKVTTFNERSYPLELSEYWTVMFLYSTQMEHYAILVRKNFEFKDQIDLRLVVSSFDTTYKELDIILQESGSTFTVYVDGVRMNITRSQYQCGNGNIQIYAISNGIVKVQIRDTFSLLYNGRIIMQLIESAKFDGKIRGLCGTSNGRPSEDFLTAENCIARMFVRSYEMGRKDRNRFGYQSDTGANQCTKIHNSPYHSKNFDTCSFSQTRYHVENEETCFSISALTSCSSQCKADRSTRVVVPVHCIHESSIVQLWKTQIDRGVSPDFSHKKVTKEMEFEIPLSCVN